MYDLPETGKYKGVLEMDKDIITNFENLYRSYRNAKRGKSHNGSCARFQNMSLEGNSPTKRTVGESDVSDWKV